MFEALTRRSRFKVKSGLGRAPILFSIVEALAAGRIKVARINMWRTSYARRVQAARVSSRRRQPLSTPRTPSRPYILSGLSVLAVGQVGMLAATVVTGILWVLGVQMAYVFGIITFVLNFVPNLGPMIATFLPMPLVIFDPGGLF